MPDLKFQQINGGVPTTPLNTDIFPYVSDPFGSPTDKIALFGNIIPATNTQWATQSTWAIDPINGNDANVGAGTLQVQTIVFSGNIITGNSISIDFITEGFSAFLQIGTIVQAFNTDNATTLQALTNQINGNILAAAVYDGLHTITIAGIAKGVPILINRDVVTGGASQATITITETVSAFTDSLKTWAELRRRMLAVGGHTSAVDIYIAPSNTLDIMLFDWGSTQGIINIHGTPTIVRNGSLTGFSARNPALNTPNIITDSGVSDWTSEIGFTSGYHLYMTSGAAIGTAAGIVKNLGSHQARVGSFYNASSFIEVNPSNGDKYSIISKPFVQDFAFINPNGFINPINLDFGDTNSSRNEIEPISSTFGIEFTNCAIFFYSATLAAIYNLNSILKYCPSLYCGSQIQNFAGIIGDITNSEGQNEVEQASEFECDNGVLFQGVGLSPINNGYLRIYDAGFFDITNSPGFAISVGNGGKARLEKAWGSGTILEGLLVTNTGQVWGTLSQLTVTGTGGDVYFCNNIYTWAQIQASNGIEINNGFGCIIQNNLSQGRNQLAIGINISAANNLTLGTDGNIFTITGNTQINAIITAGWRAGAQIILKFTGTPTIKNNTAGGAGTAVLLLAGSADFIAANNTILGLFYDGIQWQETFRKVA